MISQKGMRYELEQLNDRVECCFVYVDNLDDVLRKSIKENLVEIIVGKNESERIKIEPDDDTIREAAKYIYKKKKCEVDKLGTVSYYYINLRVA